MINTYTDEDFERLIGQVLSLAKALEETITRHIELKNLFLKMSDCLEIVAQKEITEIMQ